MNGKLTFENFTMFVLLFSKNKLVNMHELVSYIFSLFCAYSAGILARLARNLTICEVAKSLNSKKIFHKVMYFDTNENMIVQKS